MDLVVSKLSSLAKVTVTEDSPGSMENTDDPWCEEPKELCK